MESVGSSLFDCIVSFFVFHILCFLKKLMFIKYMYLTLKYNGVLDFSKYYCITFSYTRGKIHIS